MFRTIHNLVKFGVGLIGVAAAIMVYLFYTKDGVVSRMLKSCVRQRRFPVP